MKKKKRLFFILCVTLCSILLTSCTSFRKEIFYRNDNTIADERLDSILECLKNGDKEKIKNMFSINALKESEDIDGDIEYLIEFFKGEVKNKDRTVTSSSSKRQGGKRSELDCMYIVTTDKEDYLVFFIDNIVDTKDSDNIGLYMLQIIKNSDRDTQFDWGNNKRCAGVYRDFKTSNNVE